MTRLLLRLHRTTLLLAAATTALAVVVFVTHRVLVVSALTAGGVPESCITDPAPDCRALAMAAVARPDGDAEALIGFWGWGHLALLLVPLVLGLLTGAGIIARETGADAHLLTLTQALGRTRWWTGRLALAAGVAAGGALLVGAVGGWAFAPLDGVSGPPQLLQSPVFETSGLVPAGHAVLACALAAVITLLGRSAALAALVTSVTYGVVVFVLAADGVRGAYLPPLVAVQDAYSTEVFSEFVPGEGDWRVSDQYVDAAGRVVPDTVVYAGTDDCTVEECLRQAGVVALRQEVQPASRYWPFQLIETGILVVLAACAVAVGSLRLRRSLVR